VEKFLHRGSAERVLYHGSMDDCADPLFDIEHHNDAYAVEAWRSSYTVEVRKRVLYRGSMDDCVDPLLGIKPHNDSCAMEVWRSS